MVGVERVGAPAPPKLNNAAGASRRRHCVGVDALAVMARGGSWRNHREAYPSDSDDDDPADRRSKGRKDQKPFDPSNRDEGSTHDEAGDTKLSRRQGRASRFGGLAGIGIWTDALDFDDDDDAPDLGQLLDNPRRASAEASTDSKPKGKGKESLDWGLTPAVHGVTADFRSIGQLAEGFEVVGGDPAYEEQEDGGQALLMPEGSYLKLSLPHVSPWSLEDDGRVHRFSLLLAMRLDSLPAQALPLFNGGGPDSAGDPVQVYKNGGVGALGQMGAAEAAVRAERWAWVAVTRKDGELNTYVDGRLCAEMKLEAPKADAKKKAPASEDAVDEKALAGAKAAGKGGKEGATAPPPERFCVDPQHLAIFVPREGGEEAEAGERGLALRYAKLVTTCWSEEQVRDELQTLRGRDIEAELEAEAEADRAQHLSLQSLYAKPPPIWLHPAFAAEFGDAFIADTALEAGSLHISLEVVVLALGRMLKEAAEGSAGALPHAARSALNSAHSLLDDATKLAHKLSHALAHPGQQRMYLSRVLKSLDGLQPGASLVLPCAVGEVPIMLLISRGATPDEETCRLTVVSCDPEVLAHHRCTAEPPKLKYETCLSLNDVQISKVKDEAFWAVLWFAATSTEAGRLSPVKMFYQVLLSFLTDASLEQAMLLSEDGEPTEFHTPRRSASAHYGCVRHALRFLLRGFGVAQDDCRRISLGLRVELLAMAQRDLAFVSYVTTAERSILHIACRQLAYKAAKLGADAGDEGSAGRGGGGGASSSVDALAPQPSLPLALSEMRGLRERIEKLKSTLLGIAGAAPTSTSPPPLILSESERHLGRPSLPLLLGAEMGGRLLLPPELKLAGGGETSPPYQPAAASPAPPTPATPATPATPPTPASAVAEAMRLEAAGLITPQERQRRVTESYASAAASSAAAAEVTPEEALEGVEVCWARAGPDRSPRPAAEPLPTRCRCWGSTSPRRGRQLAARPLPSSPRCTRPCARAERSCSSSTSRRTARRRSTTRTAPPCRGRRCPMAARSPRCLRRSSMSLPSPASCCSRRTARSSRPTVYGCSASTRVPTLGRARRRPRRRTSIYFSTG